MTVTQPAKQPRGSTTPPLNRKDVDIHSDIEGATAAMRRAAERARRLAVQTGTDLIVVRDGQVVRASPVPKD